MTRGADVARGTRAHATRHTTPRGRAARAHAAHGWRTSGADAWQGPHESTRTPEGGATWREGAGIWRAHGLVGRG